MSLPAGVITFDGLDDAIIGYGNQWSREPVAVSFSPVLENVTLILSFL